jgi:HK97 family phage prohead protease
MPKTLELSRTFTGGGDRDLEVPVDALGRMRHRALLDIRTVARADGDDAKTVAFHGHAAVFNKRTLIGGKRWGFWESIATGAFTKTIGEADVRFLVNHDPTCVMARNKAGTLSLAEDTTGLVTDAPGLDTRQTYTNDVVIALERGDVSQMSFAFEPMAWRYEEAEDGKAHYILTEVRLWDVSVVTYPAYEDTDAGLRGAAFAAMTRSLGLDEAEVLARYGDADLGAYLTHQISSRHGGTPGPAEPTQDDTNGPADATRTDSPPAETTGTTNRSALARRTLAAATALHSKEL